MNKMTSNSVSFDQRFQIRTRIHRQLADTVTPVSIYLKLRDHFASTVLLESTDFRSKENCFSFIGLQPIAGFKMQQGRMERHYPDGKQYVEEVSNWMDVPGLFNTFLEQFKPDATLDYRGINGFFGHTNFDAFQYFDSLRFDADKRTTELPDINYQLYRFVIAINHFKEEMYILENVLEDQDSELDKIISLIARQNFGLHQFELVGDETSNLDDEQFKELVRIGKRHCQLGDVFQIVFSRQFSQAFRGDDFSVYRVLRSINPSPYLFYFDYGSYKIFGSSPEAQMVISNGVASVNPIAGTYQRSGDDEIDRKRAQELAKDPKENAEHIMLVDLARNDLGRHSQSVAVKELKDIQFFSHVIHLVSKVEGVLDEEVHPVQVFADTFPAGTLSGAPKYKAIQLIDQYENQNRSFYGGSIGYIGFNGDMNQAIVIRSFLSKNNVLYYQAGAGVVAASEEEKELQEVNNKLGALKKALIEATQL